MSLLKWLTSRDSEQADINVDKAIQSIEMRCLRDYAIETDAALGKLKELDMLLSAPKVEFNLAHNRRLTVPFEVGGYGSLEIIFDKTGKLPICATLQE